MPADEPYREKQPDIEGRDRFVWVFPLRLKSGAPPVIPAATLQQLNQLKEKRARKLSDAEVEALAQRQGRVNVGKRSAKVMNRSYMVEPIRWKTRSHFVPTAIEKCMC